MIKKNYSELFEFTSAQLATLKKEYEPLKGKTMSMANINKLNAMLGRLSKEQLVKLANTDIPFVSTGAKSVAVMKKGMKWSDFKRPLDMSEADELQCEACWTGYKQVGFKTSSRTGRRVPNCVPESVVKEMLGEVNDIRGNLSDAQLERMKQEWKNKPASALTQGVKQTIMKMDAPTRAALENAKINHISKFAGSTFEQKEEVDPSCKICEGEACECAQGEDFTEASKYLRYSDLLIQKGRMQAAKDKQGERQTDIEIEKEKKKLGITDEFVPEADLSKSQVKMVHKKADDLPKKDFMKRYGKDGDSVRYATATNMVKKQLGIEEEEFVPEQNKGDNMNEAAYKDKFNAAMKDFGINSLDDLKSDADKKKFFKHVDGMHTAKNEELTPAQKKLPAGLQKAIAKKQGDKEEGAMKRGSNLDTYKPKPKKEEVKEMGNMNAQYEMMKKEMMKKVEMMKAEKDPEQMEMMKKEMMKEMEDMPEMMKQEMMKKMEMAMKEGFSSDAQRKAAFASGYKEKGKDKKEMMKMNAMRMPIKSMYSRAGKTGDDDMSPVNNMKLNAMIKDPHKSKEDKPMKDMNAMYMKSDVRADVKNNGGADMAKVKDAPKMQTAMKKINAMYKTEKYLDEKEGSIQNTVAQMFQAENRLVEVQDKNLEKMISDYLKKGGTISKLPPALAKGMKPSEMKPHKVGDKGVIKSMYKMKEVREFVDTYNKHFLVNFKAEELLER